MRMQNLKAKTYTAWECLSTFNGALVQTENFKPEVRRIGDMRYKATWERAYAQFTAKNIMDCFEGCYSLITFHLNPSAGTPGEQELLGLVLDEFLATEEGLDLIREGLEQIFGDSYYADEKESAHEFLAMVAERGAVGAGSLDRFTNDPRGFIGSSANR